MPEAAGTGIKVVSVRVRNFRSLREVDVELSALTLLVGENNAGKTSFLEALFSAIGAGRRTFTSDDVYIGPNEQSAPRDREIIVDILVRPTDAAGKVIATFPEGSYWLQLWGNGVAQDIQEEFDFVAVRTKMAWNPTRNEHYIRRQFLLDWAAPEKWHEAKVKDGDVGNNQLEPLALHFLDAQRDLNGEFSNRGSYWYRLISEPGLSPDLVKKLEEDLTSLNESIIQGSPVLDHIGKHLGDLYQTVSCERESISITPLPRHLRDLSRGMDVQFGTRGAATLPLARHGMGTRSLAAILVFRAYCAWRMQAVEVMHPMLALEEPEAHLHPQAQRAMMQQIHQMPGQRLVSTHSPFIVAHTDITDFRVFRKAGADTVVTSMPQDTWTADEKEKVNRKVTATRGEILFARAVIYFEGETEEFALPVFAETYWHDHPSALGVTMVNVGGDAAYRPFLRLAKCFGIPWFIFSDGEPGARENVRQSLVDLGEPEDSPRVFTIPDGKNFETYLADLYPQELRDMVINQRAQSPQHRQALTTEYAAPTNLAEAVKNEMSTAKASYGRYAAEAICSIGDPVRRTPGLIANLFQAVDAELRPPPAPLEVSA